MTKSQFRRTSDADSAPSGERQGRAPSKLLRLAKSLEPSHRGDYVMINTANEAYVLAPTISAVHAQFIETFGPDAPGFCIRIGASPFAAA